MVKMQIVYRGFLECEATHEPSQIKIRTDAPLDNGGKASSFSPTDLVGAALGSCMITLMAIVAERRKIDLKGLRVEVTKEMIREPIRRIGKLTVTFDMPQGVPEAEKAVLERAALTCPVHQSLHPDIEIPVKFNYPS